MKFPVPAQDLHRVRPATFGCLTPHAAWQGKERHQPEERRRGGVADEQPEISAFGEKTGGCRPESPGPGGSDAVSGGKGGARARRDGGPRETPAGRGEQST